MSVHKLLLIRHGETDFNRQRRMQGTMPVPLNAHGRQQAAALAYFLQGAAIDALYTSPILRARETAQIIGKALKLPLREDFRLREIEFGIFEGLTYDEASERYPDAAKAWGAGNFAYKVPDGESRGDVQMRMRAAWDDIIEQTDLQTVAVVTHGTAIALFLRGMFAQMPDDPIKNSSMTTLLRCRDIWRIAGFSQTRHLAE